MLILLSGPVGVGKTTLCLRLADEARSRGFCVSGVLAPAVIEAGIKVGIQALDLSTGEGRPLARFAPDDYSENARAPVLGGVGPFILGGVQPGHQVSRFRGTRVGPYAFDDLTLDWVVALCSRALAEDRAGQGSLIFVDEIGKLELNRGEGLAPLIPLLARSRGACVIVIVREALLDLLLLRVEAAEPRVVTVDPNCRHRAWSGITSLALGEAAGA